MHEYPPYGRLDFLAEVGTCMGVIACGKMLFICVVRLGFAAVKVYVLTNGTTLCVLSAVYRTMLPNRQMNKLLSV